MTPTGVPSTGVTVTFYLVDPYSHRITSGGVAYQGTYHPVGPDGKVPIYDVPKNTVISVEVKGQYFTDFWNHPQFDFMKDVNIGSADLPVTIWVESQIIEYRLPPTPPVDPYSLLWMCLTWLIQNWWLALGIAVLVYLSPHILNLLSFVARQRQVRDSGV
jgi:hypothetical protein